MFYVFEPDLVTFLQPNKRFLSKQKPIKPDLFAFTNTNTTPLPSYTFLLEKLTSKKFTQLGILAKLSSFPNNLKKFHFPPPDQKTIQTGKKDYFLWVQKK